MNVKAVKEENNCVLKVIGPFSGPDIGKFTQHVQKLQQDIIVDLSEVTFIDSHGLGALIYCWKLMRGRGFYLSLRNPQGQILDVLTSTNMDKVFKLID